jgi:hypothetical protein
MKRTQKQIESDELMRRMAIEEQADDLLFFTHTFYVQHHRAPTHEEYLAWRKAQADDLQIIEAEIQAGLAKYLN